MKIFRLLDRYCYGQFIVMLMVGTTLPAGVFFFTEQFELLVKFIKEWGLPIDLFFLIMGMQMPEIIVRCLPAGIFLGIVLALYRLGVDSEIIALQTSGISLLRIFQPFLVVGCAAALLSFSLNEFCVPYSIKLTKSLMRAAANRAELPSANGASTFIGYQRDKKGKIEQVIVVASRIGRDLGQIMLFDVGKGSDNNFTWAPKGEFKKHDLYLFNGHVYRPFNEGAHTSLHFTKMSIKSPTAMMSESINEPPRPEEMSSGEFKKQMDDMRKKGRYPSPYLLCLYHERFSQPMACVFIAISAFPMALLADRRRAKGSLGYGAVVLVGYFIILDAFFGLGENGRLDPMLAVWLPGLILGAIGGVMLLIKARR